MPVGYTIAILLWHDGLMILGTDRPTPWITVIGPIIVYYPLSVQLRGAAPNDYGCSSLCHRPCRWPGR